MSAIRQNANPVQFDRTRRPDNASILTSCDAGVVAPITCVPLHRGDSAAGRMLFDIELAEMPKPLENAVIARAQAWFVPRPALPYFSGLDEYTHSVHGKTITRLGSSDRTAPALYNTVGTGAIAAAQTSEFFSTLGLYLAAGEAINTDYIDAYVLVQNFRLAAHSSKLTRYDYYSENATTALELKPALWPRNRMHQIVPDYEQALVVGALDLDVSAGAIPVSGLGAQATASWSATPTVRETGGSGTVSYSGGAMGVNVTGTDEWFMEEDPNNAGYPGVFAEMAGQTIAVTLADIDKARTVQAFAKAQASFAGNNYSGFNNDDVIISELMQGFTVPEHLFNRPWLLDSKTVVFGMQERFATDAANLDDSVSVGRASASLSINVPRAEYGGVIIATVEIVPERLYERQRDEYLYVTDVDDTPNALRDTMRAEPVDTVINARIDQAHTTPGGAFGYEPMNSKWKRERTTLGGSFRQTTPGTPITTARTAIWQADYVDPAFTSDHWVCPHPFPQAVFSVPGSHIANVALSQQIMISGITQFGDELVEDNGEFLAVEAEAV